MRYFLQCLFFRALWPCLFLFLFGTAKGSASSLATPSRPNILLILLDDLGFGHTSTFGGPIPTPTLDKLAEDGLRYNQFHTTSQCSPTRAALLTGRYYPSTQSSENSSGNSSSYVTTVAKSTATLAEILKQNGYNTAAFGKWHNTPESETTTAGPFDRWPTHMGFEYFYGFLGGGTDQWHPNLIENTKRARAPEHSDYILTTDQADKAIGWLKDQHVAAPDKPFFIYYAPGAAHAPHHAPKEWIEKFKGKFDHGWDKVREETFIRQKKMGLFPSGTQLPLRPKEIKAWDDTTKEEKRLFARMQEVFAAYLSHADYELGRIIDTIAKLAELDNTLIIYIAGDNGPSAEGALNGTVNELKVMQGVPETVEDMLKVIDKIGGPDSHNHYPMGWAWAGSSPIKWTKQEASHFGGTRNAMVISWPDKIKEKGALRRQFHHVTDIVPTLLEVTETVPPAIVNGIPQAPIDGISMAYTFNSPEGASKRHSQLFDLNGQKAFYEEGWVAVSSDTEEQNPLPEETWKLYHIAEDFGENTDFSEKKAEKLEKLKKLYRTEAAKYEARTKETSALQNTPTLSLKDRTSLSYLPGTIHVPEASAPDIKNKSWSLSADILTPAEGLNGIIAVQGGRGGGWVFMVQESKPLFIYNYFGEQRYIITSQEKIPPGKSLLRFEFEKTGQEKFGAGGIGKLFINGKKVGEGKIDKTVPFRFSSDENFDVGEDTGSQISDAYPLPFKFSGTLNRVTVDIGKDQQKDAEAERAFKQKFEMRRQ